MTDKTSQSDERADDGPEQVEAFDPLPGDLLREARNRRGWTQSRVAEDMNLEVRFIEAMEENRFEDLGAPVFARGHLRKYARLLEVDPDRLMDAYSVIERERIPPPAASAEGLRMTGDEPSGGGAWKLIAVLLVVAALAVLAWRLLMTESRAPATVGQAVSSPRPADDDDDERDDDALGEPVAVPMPAIVTTTEPPSEADAFADRRRPPSEDVEEGAGLAAGSLAEQTTPEAVPPGEARIVFRFTADSWVEVRDADGSRLVYQLGRAGRQRSVTGTPPFDIFLGFADGVSVELNGEAIVIPPSARLGRTARFRLPADTAAAVRP